MTTSEAEKILCDFIEKNKSKADINVAKALVLVIAKAQKCKDDTDDTQVEEYFKTHEKEVKKWRGKDNVFSQGRLFQMRKIFNVQCLHLYLYYLGLKDDTKNWTNGDYFSYTDKVIGTDYVYEVRVFVPAADDIAEDINQVSWIECGNSDDVTPDDFIGLTDLKDKTKAIRNEETKLLLLGVPFAERYEFDEEWKKQLNEENRKVWKKNIKE